MCKKILAVTLGAIVAVYVLSHTKAGSYITTAWKQIKNDAREQVSVEFEIDRIKSEIANLDRDIDKQRGETATRIVENKEQRGDVKSLSAQLATKKERVAHLLAALKAEETTVSFDGEKLTAKEAETRYRQELRSGQLLESRLQAKGKLLAANEQLLASELEKLNGLQNDQNELLVTVTLLEAEFKTLQAKQKQNSVVLSSNRLTEIKQSAKNLQKRIDIEKTKQDLSVENGTRQEEKSKSREVLYNEGEQFLQNGKGGKVAADK